jgi:steroid delta-isomerase-like uncharacterized protein
MVLRSSPRRRVSDGVVWTSVDDAAVLDVIGAVLREPGRDWTIAEFAKRAAMSRATFIRHFSHATGMAVGEFMTGLRMAIAADMLADGDRSVSAIAAAVGYRSESAFGRAFRLATATTPARFRANARPASGTAKLTETAKNQSIPPLIAIEDITSIRQRREAIVRQHAEAENRHDVEATIATFHHPRYEVNGDPSDGTEAVRELLQSLMQGFPDLHAEIGKIRHADDAVFGETLITGTHDGEWAGIPPTGRRVEVPVAAIFEFDEDRLLCEKVYMDFAAVLTQIGVLLAVG